LGKITATDEELLKLYETRTLRKIAALYGCNDEAVRQRLKRAGAKMRPRGGTKQFDPPRQELEILYQSKSMREIAKVFEVGETVVWKRLKEHGIVLRDFESGGHRLKPGRQFSKAHRKNLSKAHKGKWSGERNPHWRGGVHQVHLRLRGSGDYKMWKNEALELRGFKCQQCGVVQNNICECCGTRIRLHVHHIESFAAVPEKRFDPHNSEVLCPRCHHSRHHGKPGELRETPNV
jgi:hypothetical protein